jgi:copper chaperone CopZ
MDIVRAKIDVEVEDMSIAADANTDTQQIRNVNFKWARSSLPFGLRKAEEKPILTEITSFFPAGEVSAILVSHFKLRVFSELTSASGTFWYAFTNGVYFTSHSAKGPASRRSYSFWPTGNSMLVLEHTSK